MGSTLPPMNQPPPSHTNAYRSGPQLYARPTPLENAPNPQQSYTLPNTTQPANASKPMGIKASECIKTSETAGPVNQPIITVFVGNISERAPEPMIKKILATVGTVISWKRVSTFGFCEYE